MVSDYITDSDRKKWNDRILGDFRREAHKVIHKFVDLYDLDDDYVVTDFAVQGISSFLLQWRLSKTRDSLPDDAWSTVIEMYMGLTEIDYDYLDEIEALLERYH